MAKSFRVIPGRAAAWHRWVAILVLPVVMAGCQWCGIEKGFCKCVPDTAQCDSTSPETNTQVAGLNIAYSRSDISTTYSRLRNRINARPETYIVEQIDYSRRAAAHGETLPGTGVILLAAPGVAVPLIQANPLAALSLPQAMVVYQTGDEVAVAYNDPAWLRERYGLARREQTLAAMDELLTLLAQSATLGSVGIRRPAIDIGRGEGVVVTRSNTDFTTTVARLKAAIRKQKELNLLEVFNHEANAARIGSSVNPARLFLLSDIEPAVELLRAHQSIAVNLPLRMLVYQDDDGDVHIAYNDPAYLAERHGIDNAKEAVENLTDVLEALADTAANGS